MVELILEDIPDDDSLVLEDVPEKIKPKPETIKVAENTSDPFKQGLAGITDAISGVPALAGMIGSAGEAAYNKITEGPDINKSFSTYYDQAAADLDDTTEKLHLTNKVRHETEIKLGEEIEKCKGLQEVVKIKEDTLGKRSNEIEELDKKVIDLERT